MTLKGTVVNVTTTMDGMKVVLLDLDGNYIDVYTSSVCLFVDLLTQTFIWGFRRRPAWTLLRPSVLGGGLPEKLSIRYVVHESFAV